MNTIQNKRLCAALRYMSVLFVALVVVLFACTYFLMSSRMRLDSSAPAENGRLNLNGYHLVSDSPVLLDGSWEYYPGRLATEDTLQRPELWKTTNYESLPVANIAGAESFGSYRLRLTIDDFAAEDYVLYLPNLKNDIELFVNGQKCSTLSTQNSWADISPFSSTFFVGRFDPARAEQEIVVTANLDEGDTVFFKRSVVFGAANNVLSYAYLTLAGELLSFGAIVLVMLTAFIFMVFLPDHKLMTLITLFDFFLMLRVMLGLTSVMELLTTLFGIVVQDSALLSIQILILMLAGASGAVLSRHLFDPENRIPKQLTWWMPFAYIILGILFSARLDWFDAFGTPVILAFFMFTFLVVFLQILVYWKREAGSYAVFQIIKTAFIGVVLFCDLLFLKQNFPFLTFSYLYMLFFTAHVTVRQYDSNLNYKKLAVLNQNLEAAVAERTRALETANRALSELSVRDPLTDAFNRLYLEQVLERHIAEAEREGTSFHCCMFDLDFFKKINDTYGHDAGDEQLIHAVQIVSGMIGTDSILTRVGGEEFVILFFGLTDEDALALVQRIRAAMEQDAATNHKRTTASFGLVRFEAGMQMKELLKHVDVALYRAKSAGRNCVETEL